MAQRLGVASALLGDPRVLLFDEPTASLDELSEERIYSLLADLQRTRGMTMLLVSHDLSVVYQSANKVLCLSKDTVCFGTPREILTPKTLAAVYSAPPTYYRHEQHRGARHDQ